MFEIGQKSSDGLIGLAGETPMIADDVFVSVPTALVVHAAGVDLNEADTPFDHAAGHQALGSEMTAVGLVQAVEVFEMFRFALDAEGVWRSRLHAVGQLEALDPCAQFAFRSRLGQVVLVEGAQQIQLSTLGLRIHADRSIQVVDRVPLGPQPSALIDAGQEAGSPVAGLSLGQPAVQRITHHHEGGQVAAFAAQAIGHPGADAGEAHARRARVDHEEGGTVVVRLGVAGVQEGHLVHVPGQVGEQVAGPSAALAVLGPGEGGLH